MGWEPEKENEMKYSTFGVGLFMVAGSGLVWGRASATAGVCHEAFGVSGRGVGGVGVGGGGV